MRLATIVLLIVFVVLTALSPRATASGSAPFAADYASGDLIVQFKAGIPGERIQRILAAKELRIERYLDRLDTYVVHAPVGKEQILAQALARLGEVRFAERDGIATAQFTPLDGDYADGRMVYAPRLLNAEAGWDFTRGSQEVIVAVVDSGLALDHPEFAGRVVQCTGVCDFVDDDTSPNDQSGHGTHVTGIIAAAIDGQGMVGIAPNVRILPVRVLNEINNGTWSDIAEGIVYAADQGARVINLSLGGIIPSELLRDALQYASDKGAVLVAAAGNGGGDMPLYPAYWDETIAVSATNGQDEWWTQSVHSIATDAAAPGSAIWSTAHGETGYQYMTGTSMAAAHVSGLAALLFSANPGLTAQEVRALIQEHSVDLGEAGWDPYFGWGRIDAGAAVTASITPEALPRGALGGFVWVESSISDGQPGPAEASGLSGIPIAVSGRDVFGFAVSGVMYTAAGKWTLAGLQPGTYTVTAPANFGLYILKTASTRTVTLTTEATSDLDLDFAYVLQTVTAPATVKAWLPFTASR